MCALHLTKPLLGAGSAWEQEMQYVASQTDTSNPLLAFAWYLSRWFGEGAQEGFACLLVAQLCQQALHFTCTSPSGAP